MCSRRWTVRSRTEAAEAASRKGGSSRKFPPTRENEPDWKSEGNPPGSVSLVEDPDYPHLIDGAPRLPTRLNLDTTLASRRDGLVAGIAALALMAVPRAERPSVENEDLTGAMAAALGIERKTAETLSDGPNWIGGARAWVTPGEAGRAVEQVRAGKTEGHDIWRHLDRKQLCGLRANEDTMAYHRERFENAVDGDTPEERRRALAKEHRVERCLIDETAYIWATAKIGRGVSIEANSTVRAGATVGGGVSIGRGCHIGEGAVVRGIRHIGAGSSIEPGCRLEPGAPLETMRNDERRTGQFVNVAPRTQVRNVPPAAQTTGARPEFNVWVDAEGNVEVPP